MSASAAWQHIADGKTPSANARGDAHTNENASVEADADADASALPRDTRCAEWWETLPDLFCEAVGLSAVDTARVCPTGVLVEGLPTKTPPPATALTQGLRESEAKGSVRIFPFHLLETGCAPDWNGSRHRGVDSESCVETCLGTWGRTGGRRRHSSLITGRRGTGSAISSSPRQRGIRSITLRGGAL